MRRGASLLEVLIGLSIVSVAVISMAGAMRQGARDVGSSAQHMAAAALEQRFVEALMQSSQGDDSDALLDGWTSERLLPLADAGHPCFAVLEDSAPPWGRLEPGRDRALGVELTETYRHYGGFAGRVAHAPVDRGGAVDVDVRLEDGDRHAFDLPLVLGFSTEEPPEPPPVPEALDSEIAAILYPDGSEPLDRAVRRAGGDLAITRDLGGVLVPLRAAALADAALAARAVEASGDLLELARVVERRAALAWSAGLSVAPCVGRLERSTGRLVRGVRVDVRPVVLGELRRGAALGERFVAHAAEALGAYRAAREAVGVGGLTLRVLHLDRRILDAAEIVALCAPERGHGFLQAWIAFLAETYRGRGPGMEAHLARERAWSADADRLTARHPRVAARLAELRAACAAMSALEARCTRELP